MLGNSVCPLGPKPHWMFGDLSRHDPHKRSMTDGFCVMFSPPHRSSTSGGPADPPAMQQGGSSLRRPSCDAARERPPGRSAPAMQQEGQTCAPAEKKARSRRLACGRVGRGLSFFLHEGLGHFLLHRHLRPAGGPATLEKKTILSAQPADRAPHDDDHPIHLPHHDDDDHPIRPPHHTTECRFESTQAS